MNYKDINTLSIVFVDALGNIKTVNVNDSPSIVKFFNDSIQIKSDVIEEYSDRDFILVSGRKNPYNENIFTAPWDSGHVFAFPTVVRYSENGQVEEEFSYFGLIDELYRDINEDKEIIDDLSIRFSFWVLDEKLNRIKSKSGGASGLTNQFTKLFIKNLEMAGIETSGTYGFISDGKFYLEFNNSGFIPELCHKILMSKLIAINVASKMGCIASFASKLFNDDDGLLTRYVIKFESGFKPDDYLRNFCYKIDDFILMTNPTMNSFRKFGTDSLARQKYNGKLCYCDNDASSIDYNSVFFDFVDSNANPYLAFFALLFYFVKNEDAKDCENDNNLIDLDPSIHLNAISFRRMFSFFSGKISKDKLFFLKKLESYFEKELHRFYNDVPNEEFIDLVNRY